MKRFYKDYLKIWEWMKCGLPGTSFISTVVTFCEEQRTKEFLEREVFSPCHLYLKNMHSVLGADC